jgi:dimethylsulfone monooxygenase
MQLGVWTPLPHTVPPVGLLQDVTQYGPGEPGDETYANFAYDVIQRADELGFHITLVAERFMGPDVEAWVLASALAARTSRIRIMPAVHPGIVNPQLVAKLAASLDLVSGGRTAINVVNGWWEKEFETFSNGAWLPDREAQYRRMDEFMEVLRLLWSGEPVSYDGEFYRLDDAQLPWRPVDGPPPIFGASSSPAGRDAMARHGDVWFLGQSNHTDSLRAYDANFDTQLAWVAEQTAAMREIARSHGREIRCGFVGMAVVRETLDEAMAIVDDLDRYAQRGFLEAVSVGGSALVGSPERVAERVRAMADAGVDVLMLKFAPMRDGLERFGTTVMPLIGDLLDA